MATIIRPQSRAEWLEIRKNGIGSSEVATILGLNPFETPLQLWRRKVGIDAPKAETFAMKAGHYLEDAVSMFYADATGKQIIKASAGDWLIQDDEKPFLQVSPDRTFWLPGETKSAANKGILECKTTQRQVDADNPPQHWYLQLQYQLGVAGYDKGALAWLTMGREFGYAEYNRDADIYAWLVEEIERFWVDNIQGGVEPQPINAADVLLRSPQHVAGKLTQASEDIYEACAELKQIKAQQSELKDKQSELEERIKMAIGDAEGIVAPDGSTLATWKARKDSLKFDEKAFKADHADTWAEYTKTIPGTRTFLLK